MFEKIIFKYVCSKINQVNLTKAKVSAFNYNSIPQKLEIMDPGLKEQGGGITTSFWGS